MSVTDQLSAKAKPEPEADEAGRLPLPAGEQAGYERLYAWLVPVAILAAWEMAARAGWLSRLFFPAPSEIMRTLVRLMGSGELPRHIAISLQRIVLGFAAGAVPGVVVGLAMGGRGRPGGCSTLWWARCTRCRGWPYFR